MKKETKNLDELLKLEESEELQQEMKKGESYKQMSKAIKRGVSKAVYRSFLKFILCIGLVTAILVGGVSEAAYLTEFNPKKLETIDTGSGEGMADFNFLLQVFADLFMPENYIYPAAESPKKTGFGNYEIPIKIGEMSDFERITLTPNACLELKWKEMKIVSEIDQPLSIFTVPQPFSYSEYFWEEPTVLKKDIAELPQSALIAAQVVFKSEKNSTELYEFLEKYDCGGSYFCVRAPEKGSLEPPVGAGFWSGIGFNLSDEFLEKYPEMDKSFEYEDSNEAKGKGMVTYFQSCLRLMLDNEEFLDRALSIFGITNLHKRDIKEWLLETSKKPADSVRFMGFRTSFKRDELLELLDSEDIKAVLVKNAVMSRFN